MIDSFLSAVWPDNFIAQLIVILIIALIILTIYLTYLNVLRYEKELRGIRLVKKNLDDWLDGFENTEYESEDANTITIEPSIAKIPIELLNQNIDQNLLISERLSTIDRLEQFHIKLNVEALQNLSIASEDQRWTVKIPGMLISISIMLGMLGTFIGLTIIVQNIVSVLPEESSGIGSIVDTANNMRNLMSGVGSAFSTTLLGLTGTIIASLLNSFIEQKQIKVFAELENFTINKLLPHTIPNIEDENVLENITHNLDASFSNLENTINHNKTIINELSHVQDGFKAIVDDVRKITIRESSNNLPNVIGQLVEMNNRLKEVSDHYDTKYKNIQELERITGKQLVDYNKIIFDMTKLPGWLKWVLVMLIIIALSALTFVGILLYPLFF